MHIILKQNHNKKIILKIKSFCISNIKKKRKIERKVYLKNKTEEKLCRHIGRVINITLLNN